MQPLISVMLVLAPEPRLPDAKVSGNSIYSYLLSHY